MRVRSHEYSYRRRWQWDEDRILILSNSSIAKKKKKKKKKKKHSGKKFIFEISTLKIDNNSGWYQCNFVDQWNIIKPTKP